MDMLAAVIAVARKKAIPAAAEELALTASAVHKRVRNTSKLLGTPLFQRCRSLCDQLGGQVREP